MEGNQQKMREALDLIADEAEVIEAYFKRENAPQYLITSVSNIINLAREYRSIPLRQCDVGTAEEQLKRHERYCDARCKSHTGYGCSDVPQCQHCFAQWSQMPYEEGGLK